jgi:hypothetical protein
MTTEQEKELREKAKEQLDRIFEANESSKSDSRTAFFSMNVQRQGCCLWVWR